MTQMTKVSGVPLDLKQLGEDGTIEGYGSIFGNIDSYGEMVMPGAFRASLKEARKLGRGIKMLWQHDRDRPIGVWDEVSEDNVGLKVKGRLLVGEVAQAGEAYALMKAGAVDGLSIGYTTVEAVQDPNNRGVTLLKKLNLREVSAVTFPANEAARIERVKHIIAAGEMPSVREFEEFLREAGFSKSWSAAVAGKAAPHLRGEPDGEVSERLKRFAAAMGVNP